MKLFRKPFKGSFAYEWQVGRFVFQVPFISTTNHPCYNHKFCNNTGLHVWRDPYWRKW